MSLFATFLLRAYRVHKFSFARKIKAFPSRLYHVIKPLFCSALCGFSAFFFCVHFCAFLHFSPHACIVLRNSLFARIFLMRIIVLQNSFFVRTFAHFYIFTPLLPFLPKNTEKLLPCAYYIIVCINSPIFRGNATICNYPPCAISCSQTPSCPDRFNIFQQSIFPNIREKL